MNIFTEEFKTFTSKQVREAIEYSDALLESVKEKKYEKLEKKDLIYFIESALKARNRRGYIALIDLDMMSKPAREKFLSQPTAAIYALCMYLVEMGDIPGELYTEIRMLDGIVQSDLDVMKRIING